MKTVIMTSAYWEDALNWLQQNVGRLLWQNPIIEWRGQGWHMKCTPTWANRGHASRPKYEVAFDDPAQAMIFALRWE